MADERGWAVAWITGASGGIGAALVAWLAGQGVKIAATARDKAKLDALAAQHAGVFAYPADVTDPEALKAAAAAIERDMGPIDLAIAGAGVYVPFDIRAIDLDGFHRTMTVNVNGVANMLAAVLPAMLTRREGHFVILGSLVGYAGSVGTGAYSASKAALINLAESLKLELEGTGVDLTIVNPGFVETGLNADYAGKKHYVMQPRKAARRIMDKLPRRPYEIAFPGRVEAFMKTVRVLPRGLAFRLLRRMARQ